MRVLPAVALALTVIPAGAFLANTPVLGPPRVLVTLPRTQPQQVDVSDDGKEIYIGANGRGQIVDASTGEVHDSAEPAWASTYWDLKSGRANPANPDELILLVSHTVETTTTAQGLDWTDLTISHAYSPPRPTQKDVRNVINLELRKTVIGTFLGTTNDVVMPGLTFGWASSAPGWIAYRDIEGRLALMNQSRRTFVVQSTSNVWLPAWTPDGTRIFFVEQRTGATVLSEIRVNTTGQ